MARLADAVGLGNGRETVPDMIVDASVYDLDTGPPGRLCQVDHRLGQQEVVAVAHHLAKSRLAPCTDFVRLPRRRVGEQHPKHVYSAARVRRAARLRIWARTSSGVVSSTKRPAAMSASPRSASVRR